MEDAAAKALAALQATRNQQAAAPAASEKGSPAATSVDMGNWIDAEEEAPPVGGNKKQALGQSRKEELESDLNHMIATSQALQGVRLLNSVVFWTISAPAEMLAPGKKATVEFNKRTKGQSKHGYGSPHIQAWRAIIANITRMVEPIEELKNQNILLKAHLEKITKEGPKRAEVTLCSQCIVKVIKDPETLILKYALSSLIDPEERVYLDQSTHAIFLHFKAEIKTGTASATQAERKLQEDIDAKKLLLGKPISKDKE